MKHFPKIQWLILQEEFRNHAFDWKIGGSSLFFVGLCYSTHIIIPSEALLYLIWKNVTLYEAFMRLLCGAPATIITMGMLETFIFHKYFRRAFLHNLPLD
jgi:hypothetical protein